MFQTPWCTGGLFHSHQLAIRHALPVAFNGHSGNRHLLEGIVNRGKITPEERTRVIQACRFVLFAVL
jgi:hypothetical protein